MGNFKAAFGAHELTEKKADLWRALLAEFLGTMLLNFFGCGTVVTGSVVAISLGFGLAVAAAIQAIGHVSGGHVNPAVTLGLLVIGKLPIVRALLYVLAQIAGAIAGSAVLRALSPETMESSLGLVSLAHGVTPVQGFGVEFILALVLVLVVCGACDPAKPHCKAVAPLVIGLAVTLAHLVGVPRTGSGMNPARALGSSLIMGAFENHWLYWVGPILGGMAGSLVYEHATGPAKSSVSYDAVATDDKELERRTGGRAGNSP